MNCNCTLIKQDINFLDKPLWFVDLRPIGIGFVWTDIDGFEYRTAYKLPDKVDNLILFYLLMKSQTNNYDHVVTLSRYEILQGCGMSTTNRQNYARVEDSLQRWKNISIKFTGSFYEQGKHITIGFGVLDNYKINKDTGKIHVQLNENWILKVKNSRFFKLINFEYYKTLKRPVSRRLYEMLCKNFKGRNECCFKLTTLGVKLTLMRSTKKKGKCEEEILYASHVLVAIKPAINEINKLAKTPKIDELTGIPQEDIFVLNYHIEGEKQERVIHFTKVPVFASEQPTLPPSPIPSEMPKGECVASVSTSETVVKEDPLSQAFGEAIQWITSIPHFHPARVADIARLKPDDVAKLYPGIRREYEKLTAAGKQPIPGWIFDAFKNGYTFKETIVEEKKRVAEEKRNRDEAKRRELLAYIEGNGGENGLLYFGQKFTLDFPESGILICGKKGGGMLRWAEVEKERFAKK